MTRLIRLAGIFILSFLLTFWAGVTFGQSRLPGKWSFSEEAVVNLALLQIMAWDHACTDMKMIEACKDIPPPRVAYGLLPGLYGSHDVGSRTVLIDLRIFGQEVAIPIMYHEMVHYLQDKKYPLRTKLTSAEACAGEEEAHTLALAFTRKEKIALGDPRIRPWSVAWESYVACLTPLP